MNTLIIKCISELMHDHECVIIPEFGAFISNECPARLDYAVHRLTPPSKEFAFNAQLTSDDGLFTSYLSEKKHITNKKAADEVHDFAMQCLAKLEVDKELELEGVGSLYYIDNQNITFVADANINFNGDAFGLSVFTAQPIFRSETYRELRTNIEDKSRMESIPMTVVDEVEENVPHKITRSNYKWYRAAAYSTIVATAMVLLGWGADKNNSELASWNPLFYSSPNEFVFKHFNGKFNTRETFVVDGLRPVGVNVPIVEFNQEINTEHVDKKPVIHVSNTKCYSIIGASLDNLEAAQKCAERFRQLGFEDATVLPVTSKGFYRVEYEAVVGKEAALSRLDYIKKNVDESAWLFVKK